MQESPTHSEERPSLLGLGVAWTRVGYGVLALAVLALVLLAVVRPVYTIPPKGIPPEGYRVVAGKDLAKEGGMALRASTMGFVSVFLWVFSALAAFVWILADIVDRRKRFIWLLPMFICPLTGLHALPLALYLFLARNVAAEKSGVQ